MSALDREPARSSSQPEALPGSGRTRSASGAPHSIGNLRWWIVALVFLGVIINYFDRTNISVAEGPMQTAFRLSDAQMGIVLSSFLWSYALMQIPAGLLLDRIGIKWVERIAAWFWSAAVLMTAVISGAGLLILSRILLGVFESPVFPGAMKAVGLWFPRSERGMATSIYDSGQRLSNVVGPPLVAVAITAFGWRGAFWVTGALSLVYAVVFWAFYRNPKEAHAAGRLSDAELAHLREGGAQEEDAPPAHPLASLSYVLRRRKVWGVSIGLGCAGYTAWMLLTWLPGYLETSLHMGVLKSGLYTAIPWLVAVVFEFAVPGWLLDRLVTRGKNDTRVRKSVLIVGMVVAIGVVGAAFTSRAQWALVWITIGTVGVTFAYNVSNSIPALISPPESVALVGSVMNFVTSLFGAAAPIVTGFVAGATGSFAYAFIVAGIILAVGIFFFLVVLGPIEQMPRPAEAADLRAG